MNKINFKSIFIIIFCLFVGASFLQGLIFYSQFFDDGYSVVMSSIINLIGIFVVAANISISDVLEYTATASLFTKMLAYIYISTVVLAPICTATAAINFIKSLRCSIKTRFKRIIAKDIIAIWGYNNETKQLIKSISGDEDYKGTFIYLFVKKAIDEEEQYLLPELGVKVLNIDDLALQSKVYKKARLEDVSKMIFFENKSVDNFELFLGVNEYIYGLDIQGNILPCYLHCNDYSIRDIIEKYDDNINKDSQKLRLECNIFNTYEIQARKLFEEHPFFSRETCVNLSSKYNNIFDFENSEENPWNVHLLIVGFGNLGQNIALRTMQSGIYNSGSRIEIDIFDINNDKKEEFVRRFAIDIYEENAFSGFDGEIKFNFFCMDVKSEKFREKIEEITKTDLYTYIALCMDDITANISTMNELKRVYDNIPIALRANASDVLITYLQNERKEYKNVYIIPENAEIYSIKSIMDTESRNNAVNFNRLYNISAGYVDEDPQKSWEKMTNFKRRSSIANAECETVRTNVFFQNTEQYTGTVKKVERIKSAETDEQVKLIEEDAVLKEMAKMEQRRWCYFLLQNGYKYGKNTSEENTHDCLCDWNTLSVSDKRYTCIYNLLSVIVSGMANIEPCKWQ